MRLRKRNVKVGIDADYQVQHQIAESTMKSYDIIDLSNKDKNKEESYKKVIQKERSEESNERKKEKEQRGSFQDIIDELKLTIVTCNTDCGSNIDQNYYRLKQGIPWSTKFRSIVTIYKCTNRLSSPEDEYNWSRPGEFESLGKNRLATHPKKTVTVDTSPTIKVTGLEDSAFGNTKTHAKVEQPIPDIIKATLDPLSKSLREVQKKQQDHADALLQLSDRVARLEGSRSGGDLTTIKMDFSTLQKDVEKLWSINLDFLSAAEIPSQGPTTISLHPNIDDTRDGNRETLEDIDDVNDVKNDAEKPQHVLEIETVVSEIASPQQYYYDNPPSPGVNTSPAIAVSTPST